MKIVGLFLLIPLLFFSSVLYTFAQEDPVSTASSDMPIEEDVSSNHVLPYPGMLPDHQFYFLKEFRDWMIGFLISDPRKKAEFDLLQADKKIAAGIFLVTQKDNIPLALTTIQSGQDFFEDAIEKTKKAQEQGEDMTSFIDELESAALKHEEVFTELFEKTNQSAFEKHAQKSQSFRKTVSNLQ